MPVIAITPTVTAVVLGHEDHDAVAAAVDQLTKQTRPPDQVIVATCCINGGTYLGAYRGTGVGLVDIFLRAPHEDDWGHRFCDWGLKLATMDKVIFVSCDDEYDPTFIERLAGANTDIAMCDFFNHLDGQIISAEPRITMCTRGNYMVDRYLAQTVGYNGRHYEADGQFIEDLMEQGALCGIIPEVLYRHL